MPHHNPMSVLRRLLPCLLLGVATTSALAGDAPPPSESVAARVASPEAAKDSFIGEYIGTFHPLGEYGGKPKPEDGKDFKPQKCDSCHTEATIERSGAAYSLTLFVDHGKDKEGKLKRERITLKGERQDKTLSFSNTDYSITLAGDEATGGRTGRMAAEIKLKRTTASASKTRATVGAYYFDGWAGTSEQWRDDPQWAGLHPPTHLTKRMIEEFADREPIWGWRDDTLEIMERQIDLAADHGIAFFAFCWYWDKDQEKLDKQPLHTGLQLFLKAKNNQRLKFCLLVANHEGHLFQGSGEWGKAAERWRPYLKHPQHVTVDGKPLVIVFNPANGNKDGFAQVQAVARRAGLPGVAIAACGSGKAEMGFTHTTHYNIIPGYAAKPEARKYAELIEAHQRAWSGSREQPHIPTLSVGWDKRPWEGPRGLGQAVGWYFPDRTPEQFATALESAIAWMDLHPEQTTAERIVLLYAWNEFGEGGYLAPTKGDPDGAYLKAVQQVSERTGSGNGKAKRILFLGNSITLHAPSANVGWPNNWGMAASAQEKDYVHVLLDSITRLSGSPPEARIDNIADFERHYDTYDLDAGLKKHLDFKPDIVVVAIGENVPALASEDARTSFKASFVRLLTALKSSGQPDLFVRGCFWPDQTKDDIMRKSCIAAGGVFVDISGLGKDESNYARSERSFAHAGVAAHPGDKGMIAIADALLKAVTSRLREERQDKQHHARP